MAFDVARRIVVEVAFFTPYWIKRFGADGLVAIASAGTVIAMALFAIAREPVVALIASVTTGAAWIAAIAALNVSAQLSLPDWVRGRGLAMYMTVMFGALTLRSALWGRLATATNLQIALFVAAVTMLAAIPLTWRWRLQSGEQIDLTPSTQWPAPVTTRAVGAMTGRCS